MRIFLLTSIFLFLLMSTNAKELYNKATVVPVDLKCEYLSNPLGLDVLQPRFSWKLKTEDMNKRGQKQTAYQILVASSEKLIRKNKADLWDSQFVNSDESINIVYNGKKLKSGTKYFWKVRIANEFGNWSDWSNTAFWTIGLFPSDWTAKWIGSHDALEKGIYKEAINNVMPDPWFRKKISLTESPKQAFIYIASIGYHELYINGQKVGDNVLAPSATNHKTRARYVTYDITKLLKKGNNVIALWLGVSWSIFPAYQTNDKPAAPIVLAQADILLAKNKKLRIVTDQTWKTHASPNTLLGYWDAHHFDGELFDASQYIDGWNEVSFDDSNWKNALIFDPKLIVSAEKIEANKLMKEIKPISISEVKSDVYKVDMGVNYAGWFELKFTGQPGDTIKFEFSERDGQSSTFGIHSKYIIGSSGKGTFCNRFNYMSGRWVQITGLKEKPTLNQIKGWMIRPKYNSSSYFECDNPLLNQIYNTTLWTFENLSLGGYMVDCPQRERRGYGGDALATTRLGLNNYELGAFYSKWIEDWRDVQGEDGNVPYTAPTYIGGGGPSWSGFCVTLPWEMYKQYGDKRILEENFPMIERWLAFLETKSENDMLVRWGGKWSFLGDWLWPNVWPERNKMEKQGKALGDTPETLFFNNCIWIDNLELAANIAEILGNNNSEIYRKRAETIRRSVHRTFFNPADNSYVNGFQGYMAIALHVDLPPKELRDKVWKRLEDEILMNKSGHIWAGITAGAFLLNTLLDNNRNDLIYEMATKEDFPGWGNMLKQNIGTFYEDWECRGSALHSSYLYIGNWFIEGLGGIQRPKSGYKDFTIAPWINKTNKISKVSTFYDSLYGRIVSNWSIVGDSVRLEIIIPPNTKATLLLDNIHFQSLKESGKSLVDVKGIYLKSIDKTSLQLESGNYTFTGLLKR